MMYHYIYVLYVNYFSIFFGIAIVYLPVANQTWPATWLENSPPKKGFRDMNSSAQMWGPRPR